MIRILARFLPPRNREIGSYFSGSTFPSISYRLSFARVQRGGSMRIIDLRSDTVTKPTEEMRRAMAAADVGDDVYGEDPTVNELEEKGAALLGKEKALFVASGTQSNLLALLCHCRRGDGYITGDAYHIFRYEGGGGAVVGGIHPQTLPVAPDGTLDLGDVEVAVNPDDFHFPRTRLLSLENTHSGKALPGGYAAKAAEVARRKGLSLHLDGARIWNAAAAAGTSAAEIAGPFDSVSACLSKGLGSPIGSILCGSRDFIREARRWRKMVGGGWRQAGIVAAAGLVALDDGYARLAEDHESARLLAAGLAGIEAIRPHLSGPHTNMLFLSLPPDTSASFLSFLRERGILAGGMGNVRLVTHRDFLPEDVPRVVAAVEEFVRRLPPGIERTAT
jgi:threonine aldolase